MRSMIILIIMGDLKLLEGPKSIVGIVIGLDTFVMTGKRKRR